MIETVNRVLSRQAPGLLVGLVGIDKEQIVATAGAAKGNAALPYRMLLAEVLVAHLTLAQRNFVAGLFAVAALFVHVSSWLRAGVMLALRLPRG